MTAAGPPYIGAAYYPEGLPPERVAFDIAQMAETGINAVRLAEFAWSRLEPCDGCFDFGWLAGVMGALVGQGIGVILCTPGAAPPVWLTEKHPEILPVRYDGHRASHGARMHYCPNSRVYRRYLGRYIDAFAREFSRHQALLGWQVDNEVYPPFGEGCFCTACEAGFRVYLRQRFGGIEQLNHAWQLTLWSQEYQDFAQVPMPRPSTPHHPSLKTAWLEFQDESVAGYVDAQIARLKRYSDKPVGTDMMPLPFIDHVRANAHTDVVMFNHYSNEESLPQAFFWFDYLKTIKDAPLWGTETDPNANGGAFLTPYRPRGFCTVNSWLPMIFGGEANLYWHWRGHRAGHEVMHGSVIDTHGRPTYTHGEIQSLAENMRKCEKFITGTHVRKARVAIHYSALVEKMMANQPVCPHPGYQAALFEHFYNPLIWAGLRVDVIGPSADLTPYEVVLSPLLMCLAEAGLEDRLRRWIEAGGSWIAGPLTGIRNRDGAALEMPLGCLESWGGARRRYAAVPNPHNPFYIGLPEGERAAARLWCDAFEPAGGRALACYCSDAHEFAGLAVVTEHKKGDGAVTLLGTVVPGHYLVALVRAHLPAAREFMPPVTDNLLCVPRAGPAGVGMLAVEHQNRPGRLTLSAPARELISGALCEGEIELPPYAVVVLRFEG